jgi:hypothetical protein
MLFFFTHPWMLAGASALVIPVILHLLLKRKKKRLRFSTIQFFLQQDEQSSKRRKLRNWLLLAMRLLIVALLVLAFSRPYWPEGAQNPGERNRRQVILIMDCSASMQSVETDGSRWTKAKGQAQKVLADLQAADQVAVLGCSAQVEVLSGFSPPAVASKVLDELEPGYGTSDLGEGLRQAVSLASTAASRVATTIYVVSDLQRAACQNLASSPVPHEIEVKALSVGDLVSPNLALTQLEMDSFQGGKAQVKVANFSEEAHSGVAVDLSLDGTSILTRTLNLNAGASTNLEFSLPKIKPGWHEVRAAVQSKDALALDNARFAPLFIPEPVRVLLVETRPGKRVFEEECFFLGLALDPSGDSTNALPTRFKAVRASTTDLINRLSEASAPPIDWLVLPGLQSVPAGAGKALSSFVQNGGGLLFYLGDGISANRYASEFRGLLPAQIGPVEACPSETSTWRIGDYETNTAVFAAFSQPNSGDLSIPEFTHRHALTPLQDAVALAFFDDGAPFLVAGALGKGRVVLANTTADTGWTDWPKHKTFVPWLHGLGQYLSRKDDPNRLPETKDFVSGDLFDLDLGPSAKKSTVRIQLSQNKESVLVADDQGRVRDPRLQQPGCYRVRDQNGRELSRVAINPPAQESDLAALRPAEFQQGLVTSLEPRSNVLTDQLWGHTRNQKELWGVLLLCALALLFMECLLANRTTA